MTRFKLIAAAVVAWAMCSGCLLQEAFDNFRIEYRADVNNIRSDTNTALSAVSTALGSAITKSGEDSIQKGDLWTGIAAILLGNGVGLGGSFMAGRNGRKKLIG